MFQKRDTFGVTSNVSVSVFGVTVCSWLIHRSTGHSWQLTSLCMLQYLNGSWPVSAAHTGLQSESVDTHTCSPRTRKNTWKQKPRICSQPRGRVIYNPSQEIWRRKFFEAGVQTMMTFQQTIRGESRTAARKPDTSHSHQRRSMELAVIW